MEVGGDEEGGAGEGEEVGGEGGESGGGDAEEGGAEEGGAVDDGGALSLSDVFPPPPPPPPATTAPLHFTFPGLSHAFALSLNKRPGGQGRRDTRRPRTHTQ